MKKTRIWMIVLCLVTLIGVMAPAGLAAGTFVSDEAGILSASEIADLENKACEINEEYDFGVFIATVDDFIAEGAVSMKDCADTVYHRMAVGGDGMLLLLSMADRDYYLLYNGSFAHEACTEKALDKLEDSFLDDFGDNDWYEGFDDYLDTGRKVVKAARNGKPVGESGMGLPLTVGIISGAVIALIICQVFKSQMKTAVAGKEASQYLAPDGVEFRTRTDRYTHTTTVRRKIERQTSSSSSGSGSSGSSGSSGRGGKF